MVLSSKYVKGYHKLNNEILRHHLVNMRLLNRALELLILNTQALQTT